MCLLLIVLVVLWATEAPGTSLKEALLEAHCINKCSNETCSQSCKQGPENVGDLLPEAANADASLLCRDENYIVIKHNPGIFVIEQSTVNGTSLAKVSNDTSVSFANLNASVQYQYTIQRVSKEGVSRPDEKLFITTNEAGHEPHSVRNISHEELQVDDNASKGFLARIKFVPAEDRSCNYNVAWWDGRLDRHQDDVHKEFHKTIKYLDFDKNYTITVLAKNHNGDRKSNETTHSIVTPTCLAYHKKLTICAPEQVEGLRAVQEHVHGKLYNVTIIWNKPDFLPDNYNIRIQRVGPPKDDIDPIDQTVSGNVTEAFFPGIEIAPQYEVHIYAESPGGTSPKVEIFCEVQEPAAGVSAKYRSMRRAFKIAHSQQDLSANFKLYHFSTIHCDCSTAPEQVEGLRAVQKHVHGKLYNVTIIWNKPDFLPDNYNIRIQRVGPPADDIDPIVQTVSGNVTEAFFPGIEIAPQYKVHIYAESPGGPSPKVEIFCEVQEPGTKIRDLVLVIILPAVTFILVLIGIFYSCYRRTKRRRYQSAYNFFEGLDLKEGVMEVVKDTLKGNYSVDDGEPLVQRDEFEIGLDRLKIGEVLGSGAFGVVKLGTMEDKCGQVIKVAIKMLKDDAGIEEKQSFHQEISMMKSTDQHPNIVSLLGYCTLRSSPLLVVEYCSQGDLQTFLRTIWEKMMATMSQHRILCETFSNASSVKVNRKTKPSLLLHTKSGHAEGVSFATVIANQLYDIDQELLHNAETVTVADLLNFGRQIATGMEFLSSNRIVHRDLAARNVLVCADKTVKISDFGLSRDIYRENVYKKHGMGLLPIKWMAIESLTHQLYTTHSDVWSFGILLWEIVTLGSTPYPGTPTSKVLKLLKSGYRMERPPNCDIQLYNIMLSCWCATPRNRPTFTKLRDDLDRLLCNVTENQYLDLGDTTDEPATKTESHDKNEH